MANTRRNVRDGQEENVNATIVDNTGANIREDAGGIDGAARGARENEMPPPPPPLVVPPMDEAMANMMPMMQAFFTQMFQCLQLSVAAVVQEGERGNEMQQAPWAPNYLDMMNQITKLKTGKVSGGCRWKQTS